MRVNRSTRRKVTGRMYELHTDVTHSRDRTRVSEAEKQKFYDYATLPHFRISFFFSDQVICLMYWGKKISEAQWCGIQGRNNGGYLQGSVISKAQEVVEVPGVPPGKVAWHFDGRQLVLFDSSHAPVRPFTSSQRSSWNSLIGRHFDERSSSQKPTLDRRLNIWGVMSWDVKDAFLYD